MTARSLTKEPLTKKPSTKSPGGKIAAHPLFFPAAAAHGALALPLFVYSLFWGWSNARFPGLSHPTHHGHEMVFGFALAIVAGFLLNRAPVWRVRLLFLVWLVGRISFLVAPGSVLSHSANILFALGLAFMTAPQFIGVAKKWRNQAFAPIILTLCAAMLVFHGNYIAQNPAATFSTLQFAVLPLALLLGFMGGRVIVPALAGYLQTQEQKLTHRVQPRLEAAFLLLMLSAMVSVLLIGSNHLTAAFLFAAAATALARLWRWHLWRGYARADLLGLGVGYGWLVVGLVLLSGHYGFGWFTPSTALHGITVGGLGTLALTVMARTTAVKRHRHPSDIRGLGAAVACLSLAALVRLIWPYSPVPLMFAALLWAAAFLALFIMLVRIRVQKQ